MNELGSVTPAKAITSVIVVCAESGRAAEYRRLLPEQDYDLRFYQHANEVLANRDFSDNAVLIVDEELSDMRGIEFVRAARDLGIDNPVLITVKKGSISHAVDAIRHGADNILTTPLNANKLNHAIKKVLREPGPIRGAIRADH
jgi:FixJ family two-component response regulator